MGQAHWMGIVYHFLGQEFVELCRKEMFKFFLYFIKELNQALPPGELSPKVTERANLCRYPNTATNPPSPSSASPNPPLPEGEVKKATPDNCLGWLF